MRIAQEHLLIAQEVHLAAVFDPAVELRCLTAAELLKPRAHQIENLMRSIAAEPGWLKLLDRQIKSWLWLIAVEAGLLKLLGH